MTTKITMSDESTIAFMKNCFIPDLLDREESISGRETDEEIAEMFNELARAWERSGGLDDPHTPDQSYRLSDIGVDVLLEHRDAMERGI
jgi:hypothetical protein